MKRSPLMSAWLGLRAIVFMAGFALITMSMGLFAPLLALIPAKTAYIYLRSWAKISLVWLRITCGIKGVMNGYENFNNDEPAVVLSNHQSTFETMYISKHQHVHTDHSLIKHVKSNVLKHILHVCIDTAFESATNHV